tara:strand:- start:273 stop:416 length:144 start_codon:yes stop_codon:yes gene_type:complete
LRLITQIITSDLTSSRVFTGRRKERNESYFKKKFFTLLAFVVEKIKV